MADKIEAAKVPAARVTVPPPQVPVKQQVATQIVPARSVFDLAESELETAPIFNEGFPDINIIQETQENIGFALGTVINSRTGSFQPSGNDRTRQRNMLQRLTKHLEVSNPDLIDALHRRLLTEDDFDDVDDFLNNLKKEKVDIGEMALLLSVMLNKKGITTTRRRKIEQALKRTMDDDECMLHLFSFLELGVATPGAFSELRRLYQHATDKKNDLIYWFKRFRQLKDHRSKLKILIRTLAFEISEATTTNIHLAAIISDLKRILHFLSIEDHSYRKAHSLSTPGITGEEIMEVLIETIQQAWISSGWIASQLDTQHPQVKNRLAYVRALMDLTKLIPETCFEDNEQQESILTAFVEYLEQLAEEEE